MEGYHNRSRSVRSGSGSSRSRSPTRSRSPFRRARRFSRSRSPSPRAFHPRWRSMSRSRSPPQYLRSTVSPPQYRAHAAAFPRPHPHHAGGGGPRRGMPPPPPNWLISNRVLPPDVRGHFISLYERGILLPQELESVCLLHLEDLPHHAAAAALHEFASLEHSRYPDLTEVFIDVCSHIRSSLRNHSPGGFMHHPLGGRGGPPPFRGPPSPPRGGGSRFGHTRGEGRRGRGGITSRPSGPIPAHRFSSSLHGEPGAPLLTSSESGRFDGRGRRERSASPPHQSRRKDGSPSSRIRSCDGEPPLSPSIIRGHSPNEYIVGVNRGRVAGRPSSGRSRSPSLNRSRSPPSQRYHRSKSPPHGGRSENRVPQHGHPQFDQHPFGSSNPPTAENLRETSNAVFERHQPTSGVIPPSRLHADKRDSMPPHLEGRGRSTSSPVKLDDVRKVKGDNNVEGESVSLHMVGLQEVTQDPSEMDLDEKDTSTTAAVHQELKSLPRLMNASNLLEDNSQENMHRLPPSAGAPSALPICSESQGTVLLRSLIQSEDSFAEASAVILKGASFHSFSSHNPSALTQSRSNPLSSGSPATGPQSHRMDHLLDADQVLLVRTMSGIKDKEKWKPMPIARGGTSIASHSDDVVSLQPQEKKEEQNPGVAHVDGHNGFHDLTSIRMLLEDLDWAAQGRHKPRTPGVLRRAVMDLVAEEIQPLCTSGQLKKSDAINTGKAAVELVLKVLPAFGSGSSYDSEKGLTEFMTPARVAKVKQLALHSTQHLWKSQGVSFRNEGVS